MEVVTTYKDPELTGALVETFGWQIGNTFKVVETLAVDDNQFTGVEIEGFHHVLFQFSGNPDRPLRVKVPTHLEDMLVDWPDETPDAVRAKVTEALQQFFERINRVIEVAKRRP
jgi:hypothetical protein